MLKKLKYIPSVLNLVGLIKNWYETPKILVVKPIKIFLRNGLVFLINDYINILQILEIVKYDDYGLKKIKNPKTIVDIGANIGDFTVLAAKKYPEAKIFAYEPDENIYSLMIKNLSLNSSDNVYTFKEGVGRKSEVKTFYSYDMSGLSGFTKIQSKKSRRKSIKVTSLFKLMELNKIKSIDLLKVDCEGAEFDIFLNAESKVYKKIKNIAVEYHDSLTNHSHQSLIREFKNNGFKVKTKPHFAENNIGIIYASK